ncbi:PepSY-associated TM helix domain-containing protein [Elongatibacter sediminis]|uniref:PepSY-associated TM helix domain-containing protein n=1 Tax=Elongatibacter sediminis TaxID=3119006 RepID=A0AAW9R9K2_9GAMM
MRLRKTLFWVHLGCGVTVGLVVLMMSVTGLLLTYERQILDWADHASYPQLRPEAGGKSLALAVQAAGSVLPANGSMNVVVFAAPERAVSVRSGRNPPVLVDPYTGRLLGNGASGLREFFATVTRMHRWFAVGDDQRGVARAITGASNLVFGFLVLSGLYLWLPRIWRKRQFLARLRFARSYPGRQARDYNWHHVLGIWAAVPLLLVISTATVFSYGWANQLVYQAFGEEPPQRRGGPPAPAQAPGTDTSRIDALFAEAAGRVPGWRTISFTVPAADAAALAFRVDRGNGAQPHRQITVSLDRSDGQPLATEVFGDATPGRQARVMIRWLHTGELGGPAGQTLAGLACIAAILLVWTGLCMAWRRLVQPVLRRLRARPIRRAKDAA